MLRHAAATTHLACRLTKQQSSQAAAAEGTTPAGAAHSLRELQLGQFINSCHIAKIDCNDLYFLLPFTLYFAPNPVRVHFLIHHPYPPSPAAGCALSSLSSCKYFYYNILSLLVFTASAWHCLLLLLLLFYTLSFHFVWSRFSLVRFSRFAFAV